MTILCHVKEGAKKISPAEIAPLLRNEKNTLWVDAERTEPELKKLLEEVFHFHLLSVEDALSEFHHPKVESFEKYIFFTLPLIKSCKEGGPPFHSIHLAFFWGQNFVVSVKSGFVDFFSELQKDLESDPAAMALGPDFLMERLLHGVFEETAPCIEDLHQQIGRLEESIFNRGTEENFSILFQLRKDVLKLKDVLSAEQEVIRHLASGSLSQICPECLPYLRDAYDDIYRLNNSVENCQIWITGLFSAHQTQLIEKTNDAMKHLAIIATIVLPLTVVTSYFGMNFSNLPGLRNPSGWLIVSSTMLSAVALMFLYFKKRRWF